MATAEGRRGGARRRCRAAPAGGLMLGVMTPVVTLLPGVHARWEERRHHRGHRRGGPRRRPARLRPPDLQRARGGAGRGGRRTRLALLGPAGHLRLSGGDHRADPLRHQRARPRLPPPARDRQALRHPRPGDAGADWSWASEWARSRRSSSSWARRSPTGGHGPTTRCAALRASLSRRRCPPTRARTTASPAWWSTRAPRQDRVPLWIGGRTARSLRRAVALGDGWVPFGLRVADLAAMIAAARGDARLGGARPSRSRSSCRTAGRWTPAATRPPPPGSLGRLVGRRRHRAAGAPGAPLPGPLRGATGGPGRAGRGRPPHRRLSPPPLQRCHGPGGSHVVCDPPPVPMVTAS